jgi:hypothetical protein
MEIVNQVSAGLSIDRQDLLKVVGVELLMMAREDYLVKARGGMGADGIKWESIQLRSLRHRQRGGLRTERKNRRHQTSSLKHANDTSRRIAPSAGDYEIGRNTDRLLNSLLPGSGQNISVEDAVVEAGAETTYAAYFDNRRPILPETIPPAWLEELERLVQSQAQSAIEKVLTTGSN